MYFPFSPFTPEHAVIHSSIFMPTSPPASTDSGAKLPHAFTTRILFCVSVPVLSEQITVHPPSVSTDLSFLMTTFFLLILCTPIAIIMVTTAGSPSGMAATAIATEVMKFLSIPSLRTKSPTMKISAVTASTKPDMNLPSLFRLFSSGVPVALVSFSIAAILPISVPMPTAVTTAVALPRTT